MQLQILATGVGIGAMYAIIAIGLSFIYGVSHILNFGYGSLVMLAAYFCWLLFARFPSVNYGIAIIITTLLMFLLGLGVEKSIIHPLRKKEHWDTTTVIATLGLAIALDSIILVSFGPLSRSLPTLLTRTVNLGVFSMSEGRIAILLVAIAITLALELFLRRSMLGMAMRAIPQDEVGAHVVGIPIDKVFSYAFGISVALGAVGGIFVGSIYHISPEGGWLVFIKAFIVVVFAGVGSLRGVLYAGLILGVVESITVYYLGGMWVMPFYFLILLIILAARPKGLFGIS